MTSQNSSLVRRLAAVLYDGLLIAAVLFLATLPFIALRAGEPVEPGNLLYQLTLVFITFAFFVGFWSRKGRTLGMQSWGLQLEAAGGESPTVLACIIRFLAAILSWVPFGLGFAWQLWDKDQLTWHDRLSGTRLVHYPKV
jgi:uncharacterized RDD family membrane protein YckC